MSPTITSLSPTSGPASGNTSVTITGTGFVDIVLNVKFGEVATSFTVDSPTQITAIAPPGMGTVQVTVSASSGTSNGVPYTYLSVPALSSVSPNQGPSTGGNSVTLTGTNLTGATAVSFGATTATSFTVDSATQITAVAPAGTGSVQVTVTSPGGTSNGVFYTYLVVATLTSVSPDQGPAAGGTTVTLTGTGFVGAVLNVKFGAVATSFTVNSATQITAIAPPGVGTVQVTVTTDGGTSNGVPYTYAVAPTLTSVSPDQGPAAGGTSVTLTGTGFTGVSAVSFGAMAATSFVVDSATQITAVAPAGTGTVQVTVTTVGGTSNGVLYSYVAVPTLISVNPIAGPVVGGTNVTLTGTDLTTTESVTFGGVVAPFTVISETQVVAVTPPGAAGAVDIVVTTGGGSGIATGGFTYVAGPGI